MADTISLPTLPASLPPSITPDWAERRKVIFTSLWFCAICAGAIIASACFVLLINVYIKVNIDNNLLGLLGSALYTLAFVATSIIGSYVFGVNFDWANSRQHLVDMISTTNGTPAALSRTSRSRPSMHPTTPIVQKAP